jgi:ubiquinone/menaquinone biosynthesis C-methylase UbiE
MAAHGTFGDADGPTAGRTLVFEDAPVTHPWETAAATIRVDDLRQISDESASRVVSGHPTLWREQALVEEIQRVLRPGGVLAVHPYTRRCARGLSAYFDVTRTGNWLLARRRRPTDLQGHFGELAPEYWDELPAHVQAHYLDRKLAAIDAALPARPGLVGLDLGCGVGAYAAALAKRRRVRVVGVDPTMPGLRLARGRDAGLGAADFAAGDSLHLPFRDEAFDFAYTINVLHHLKQGEQGRALAEVTRVLKPGAPLIVHEMNTRNPLFRFYLRKVYPRTRRIDRGDEEFVHPDRLPVPKGLRLETIQYFTFVPDFLPRILLPAARRVERALERGRLASHAIHYAARLRRVDRATSSP